LRQGGDVESRSFDAALVAAYRRERRANAAQDFRVILAWEAALIVAIGVALTFILGPRALAIAWGACAWLVLVTAFYARFLSSPRFADATYAELIAFIAVLIGVLALAYALSLEAQVTGWPAHTLLFAAVAVLVSFSTLAFVTHFRAFMLSLAVLIPAYVAALVVLRVPAAAATINLLGVLSLTAFAAISNYLLSSSAVARLRLENALRGEQAKTERLLHSLVPADVAERLKRGESIADPFPAATVAFVDIVGSSAFARQVTPDRFIATLDAVFAIADRRAQLHRVEKVKTVGDAYLVVAGARGGGDAVGAVQFALGVIRDVAAFAAREDLPIGIRAGVHTGPVIGGVIGRERSIYDYWGDTMNTAARLESAAGTNGVAVSEPVFRETRRVADYHPPRTVTLKGIGAFAVYDCAPELE